MSNRDTKQSAYNLTNTFLKFNIMIFGSYTEKVSNDVPLAVSQL